MRFENSRVDNYTWELLVCGMLLDIIIVKSLPECGGTDRCIVQIMDHKGELGLKNRRGTDSRHGIRPLRWNHLV